ncbi:hypothetical protein PT286_04260 [Neisseriaceae bacterium ESL0693]|nr:hypothetical protein [Neisseriaceae bacterium ESL0693]
MSTVVGSILLLVSFIIFITALVGLFKPSLFRNKTTNVIPSRLKLFLGIWSVSIIVFIISIVILPGGQTSNPDQAKPAAGEFATNVPKETKTDNKTPTSEPVTEETTEAESPKKGFNFDFDSFRKRANARLENNGSSYKISDDIKPERIGKSVNYLAKILFTKEFSVLVSTAPKTNKVKGIVVIYNPQDQGTATMISNFLDALAILSIAETEPMKAQEINQKLYKMIYSGLEELAKGNQGSDDKSLIIDHVQYSVVLSKNMPIVMIAAPVE